MNRDICIYMHTYDYIYVHIYTYRYIYIYVYICVCVCVCIYAYVCVYRSLTASMIFLLRPLDSFDDIPFSGAVGLAGGNQWLHRGQWLLWLGLLHQG